ncbi:MAG: phosphotransferase, partial [Mariniphaga sp.]
MIVEMHCHTSNHSACSHVSAVDLVRKAYQVGVQAIVLTDHHYKWDDEELDLLRKESGVPEIFKIFSGQEVATSDFGDILLYGAGRTYEKQKITLAEVREQNPDAAIIWAHPYRNKKTPKPQKLLSPLIDGVEIFSSNYTIMEASCALRDWHHYKFTAIGGTDTHAYSYTGSYPTIFDHPIESVDDLVKEIKAGRCRPYSKEIPRTGTTNTQVTEVVIGLKSAEERRKLIVKTFDDINAWKSGERSFQIVKKLFSSGFGDGPFRVPKPLDKDAGNLSLIEERIDGESLFDSVSKASPSEASKYQEMTAGWLSKLHNLNFRISPKNEYLLIEPERIEYYLKSLIETNNRHLQRVREIKELVLTKETELIKSRPEILVQGHGDFHPKNIFINSEDHNQYVAVIDFDSSYLLPRAFDVGTFMA